MKKKNLISWTIDFVFVIGICYIVLEMFYYILLMGNDNWCQEEDNENKVNLDVKGFL